MATPPPPQPINRSRAFAFLCTFVSPDVVAHNNTQYLRTTRQHHSARPELSTRPHENLLSVVECHNWGIWYWGIEVFIFYLGMRWPRLATKAYFLKKREQTERASEMEREREGGMCKNVCSLHFNARMELWQGNNSDHRRCTIDCKWTLWYDRLYNPAMPPAARNLCS